MSHFQRKHERQDSEMAYRNYRLSQSLPREGAFGEQVGDRLAAPGCDRMGESGGGRSHP